ncbi:DegT/DnrJ/EryC1/StrS family aminotransferase [Chromobacterium alticapitis]|uniref:DegT/DnrJ/EryC1/StrS aminotransferase n=1 Tax=Chromobacterium alticapitis TaxID=2073169 RepID=A0A2S5DHY2_9NEIS|nr:DegT/DnrJ/EryC1/StrS family aminotransferase [Chromobacterium alticapitis]POZ62639.1 DegT/DnrJ/EryC1/StrS aminotransferase [Chromobacterium alticapitis]
MSQIDTERQLAVLGGAPLTEQNVPLGQHNFPDWHAYEAAFRDIFNRQYYTNHGPLAQRLEASLAEYCGVRHAMCTTNAEIALVLAAQALGLRGKVVVSALGHAWTAQSLLWADCEPLFCDVDTATGGLDLGMLESILAEDRPVAILAMNAWGGADNAAALRELADRHGVALYFDSAQSLGARTNSRRLGGNGAMEVFSLHSENLLSGAEGGVICTDDDALAAHIRNIRSNYGMGNVIVPVVKTSNGRLSEAQAAVALHNLQRIDEYLARNRSLFDSYSAALRGVPGVMLWQPGDETAEPTHQNLLLRVDEAAFGLSAAELALALRAENISARTVPVWLRSPVYADAARRHCQDETQAERLAHSLVQLPLGARVSVRQAEAIGRAIAALQAQAGSVRAALRRG